MDGHPNANPNCLECNGNGKVPTDYVFTMPFGIFTPCHFIDCPHCIELEPVPYEEMGCG